MSRPRSRPGAIAAASGLAALALLGACADDGGDRGTGGAGAGREDSGCPVGPVRVGELLGYRVRVDQRSATTASCRFEPVTDADIAAHPGAHVLVIERRIAEDGFAAARDAVDSVAGPTASLGEDAAGVDGARGWVATVGRVVQVGLASGRRLVQVTVADGTLESGAAADIALELARDALA